MNVKAEDDTYEIFVDGAFVGNTPAKVKLARRRSRGGSEEAGVQGLPEADQITEGSELTLRAVLEKQYHTERRRA